MVISDFIQQYYINPILSGEGYNVVNTFTYAVLVIIATWSSYKLLEKLKIKVDNKFVMAFAPWVLFGTLIRLFEEAGVSNSYLLVTPMIWIESFSLVLVVFLVSVFIEKKFKLPYYKTLSTLGILSSIIPFFILVQKIQNLNGMLITLGIVGGFAGLLYFIKWGKENKAVLLCHVLDASATFTAIQIFGFRELHIFTRFLINTTSPISFIIVKVIVVGGILILIDKYSDDKNFNNFLKFIIAVIGIGPGLRDLYMLGLT